MTTVYAELADSIRPGKPEGPVPDRRGRDAMQGGNSNLQRSRAVVVVYGCFLAGTQLLWLTYVPVTAKADAVFGVSEGAVGDLAALVPVAFVVLSIPSGRWLDRRFASTGRRPALSRGRGRASFSLLRRSICC